MSKKNIAVAFEFPFASNAFNLVIEQTEDGARIQRELDEQRKAKEEQDKQQIQMKGLT